MSIKGNGIQNEGKQALLVALRNTKRVFKVDLGGDDFFGNKKLVADVILLAKFGQNGVLRSLDLNNGNLTVNDAHGIATFLQVKKGELSCALLIQQCVQSDRILETLAVSNNNLTNFGENLDGVIALTKAVADHVRALCMRLRDL